MIDLTYIATTLAPAKEWQKLAIGPKICGERSVIREKREKAPELIS